MAELSERLAAVLANIAAAARKSGRAPEEVELVAVSKTHSPEAVRELAEEGQRIFAESRVQEARAKIPLSPGRLIWHFIGRLQKNKIRAALPLFDLIHSVDSLELARQIQRIAEEAEMRPRVLLEVNISGELAKAGFSPGDLRAEAEELMALDRLDIAGLMTLAPYAEEAEYSRPHFERLRGLRDELQQDAGMGLPHLSMGMSGDYQVAVEEGATLVRVGSAIFGARSGKQWRPSAEG
jgi:pyridoxal phosphate enzyme (YggS family)